MLMWCPESPRQRNTTGPPRRTSGTRMITLVTRSCVEKSTSVAQKAHEKTDEKTVTFTLTFQMCGSIPRPREFTTKDAFEVVKWQNRANQCGLCEHESNALRRSTSTTKTGRFSGCSRPDRGPSVKSSPSEFSQFSQNAADEEAGHPSACLHRKLHDCVHDITVIHLKGLNGPCPRNTRLAHDELNILRLHARFVNLAIGLNLLNYWLLCHLSHLWLGHHRLLELLSRLLLSLRTKVLNLCLTEDDVCVRSGRLEDVRLGNNEEDILALLHCHPHDPGHWLHPELLHCLARLLLAARLFYPSGIAIPTLCCLKLGHVVLV
mmetsp:Transcript_20848/g.25563  ORF Transcript_20848/g.25563 Transcript_20848/m.25563 type:complete len:320 (-) Transcript_20848:83-1042(-)